MVIQDWTQTVHKMVEWTSQEEDKIFAKHTNSDQL
jgi:hypothetical protein